jgi:hypothetical protein
MRARAHFRTFVLREEQRLQEEVAQSRTDQMELLLRICFYLRTQLSPIV